MTWDEVKAELDRLAERRKYQRADDILGDPEKVARFRDERLTKQAVEIAPLSRAQKVTRTIKARGEKTRPAGGWWTDGK